MELTGSDLQNVIEFLEEGVDALLLILDSHTLYAETHNVDCGETEIAAADGCFFPVTVFENAGAATHRRDFPFVTLGVVGTPVFMYIISGVEVYEIREETAGGDFAGLMVKIVVGISLLIVYAPFLLPDLYGEDGGGAVAHTFVCRFEKLANNAAPFGRRVGAIIDRRENHLVATTRVDGVHVVDKRLHCLMHTRHGAVHGMLQGAFFPRKPVKWFLHIILQFDIVKVR